MVIDRASANDVMSLAVDRGAVPMHLAAVLVLDPASTLQVADLEHLLAERVPRVPRLRRRLHRTPPGLGRPVWVDDPAFDVGRQLDVVRLAGHDPCGGAPEREAVSRAVLHAAADAVLERLPGDRSPWRVRVLVDELGVRAVVVVLHHVLSDGIGGLAVLAALADAPRDGPPPPAPAPPPTAGELARDAWSRRRDAARALPHALRDLRRGARELGVGRPSLVAPTSLLRPTGPRRRLDVVTVPLSRLREAGEPAGATVNDLVVAAVGGALADLAHSRGERLPEVVVSVPVSARGRSAGGALGNQVGVLPVRVPATADREARLAAVVAETARLRDSGPRGGSAALLTPAFRLLAAVGAFQRFVTAQRLVHTFETNVRGPDAPLSLAGGRVAVIVPVATNPGNVSVSFDVLSYAGTLAVTVVSDPDVVPDLAVLLDALRRELASPAGR